MATISNSENAPDSGPIAIPPILTHDEFEAQIKVEYPALFAKASGSASAFPLKWHGDVADAPLKEWLVDMTLPKVGKAIISGQWGTYKTFVALDLARAVMTKTAFAGRVVSRQGGVLFIVTDGQDEVRVRLEGLARAKVATICDHGDAKPIDPEQMPFAWIESAPRLTADDAAEKLRAIVGAASEGMKARFGLPLALIVIDTLMPAAGFRDANDASETQRVMDVLTTVALEAQALVLPLTISAKT